MPTFSGSRSGGIGGEKYSSVFVIRNWCEHPMAGSATPSNSPTNIRPDHPMIRIISSSMAMNSTMNSTAMNASSIYPKMRTIISTVERRLSTPGVGVNVA
jgi:hypothetical protein